MNSLKQRKKKEFWWNVKVKTVTNLKNNRPDLIIWDLHSKECQVVEFSCPGDINVTQKSKSKENTYDPLLRNLQILYPEYSYQFIPIIIGALGSIPCNLKYNLKCLGFSEKEVNKQIKMLQIKSITGSVKIVKSFLKFKCWSDCVSNFIYNGWPIFTLLLVITFSFTPCVMFKSINPSLVSSSLSQGYTLYLILIWSSRWTLF